VPSPAYKFNDAILATGHRIGCEWSRDDARPIEAMQDVAVHSVFSIFQNTA